PLPLPPSSPFPYTTALPIFQLRARMFFERFGPFAVEVLAEQQVVVRLKHDAQGCAVAHVIVEAHEAYIANHFGAHHAAHCRLMQDRKSTRLNSSHDQISYAV